MKIITVPHSSLRQVAAPVEAMDQKLKNLVKDLSLTLVHQDNPRGVGLAAPQVDALRRLFATNITEEETSPSRIQIYINPEIIEQSTEIVLGPTPKEDVLEGCLSIPKLYGPVPRHRWVRLQYQVIDGDELTTVVNKYAEFEARVIQHELDHLNGILFTDYSLKYDLPVYQGSSRNDKLEEIDKRVLEAF